MAFSMQLLVFLAYLVGIFHRAEAAGKTYIYIDQVPLYTKLASCAQDRISAIVRAQASGCGDDTQLTSFACFCIDSSREFASIISTAVEDQCSSAATDATLTARHIAVSTAQLPARSIKARAIVTSVPTPTGPAGARDVRSALEVFDSYCSKSTELTRFQGAPTESSGAPQTIYVTVSPSPSPASEKKTTPIASIVVPTILIPLALGVAIYFFLRYRRQQRRIAGGTPVEVDATNGTAVPTRGQKELSTIYRNELYTAQHRAEMPQNQDPAVELDAGSRAQHSEKHIPI